MVVIETPKNGEKFKIDNYHPHNPQLILYFGNRSMSFSIQGWPVDSQEWLGNTLHRQISEMIDIKVNEAVKSLQGDLRGLLGIRQ